MSGLSSVSVCVHTSLVDEIPPAEAKKVCQNVFFFTESSEIEEGCRGKDVILAAPSEVLREINTDAYTRVIEFNNPKAGNSTKKSFFLLPQGVSHEIAMRSIEGAIDSIRRDKERDSLAQRLNISHEDIRRITEVGKALATEKDFDKLISLILLRARELVGADGGSIYLVERPDKHAPPTHIRFKRSALELNANEFRLPIDKKSIAGYVALTGEELLIDDVHNLPREVDYQYNSSFDKLHNYHTKSMMVIPMKNHRNDVIGVIQLINRKREPDQPLTLDEMKGHGVIPFGENDLEIVRSVAGQAAVAIENNILIFDISQLFESFVKASVTAIEARDPTTSGHSFRVAEYAVSIAESVNRVQRGDFHNVNFDNEQLRELRYASLLHDFGKVGVREHVLVKAKKLYPDQVSIIEWRFRYIKKTIENYILKAKIKSLKTSPPELWAELEAGYDREQKQRIQEVEKMFGAILDANEPSVLEEGSFDLIRKISTYFFELETGERKPYLEESELYSLSIRRGTLDDVERHEIESHVTHTFNFLNKIPWTKDLRDVAEIAYGHHEKLDGTGYPLGLDRSEIKLQTRMMTIADIYDALTAWDRPYKKAITPEKALDILITERDHGKIDPGLLDVFIEKKIFEKVHDLKRDGSSIQVI